MRLKLMLAMMLGMFCAAMAPAQEAPTPAAATDVDTVWVLDLSNGGQVRIQLRPDKAPLSVERIQLLTRRGFYDGLTFHRVIEGFMAQGGDPKGDGSGGSDLPDLKAEFNDLPHVRGTLSMARAQSPDSANSQFFIMLMPNLNLDGNYTAVGRVISGMQYVDAIEKGEPPANPTRIVKASLAAGAPLQAAGAAPVVAPRTAEEQAEADKQARDAMEQAVRNAEQDEAGQQQ